MHFIRPYTFIYLSLQKQLLSGHLSIIFNPDQISFFLSSTTILVSQSSFAKIPVNMIIF